jgi:hypothetical protein
MKAILKTNVGESVTFEEIVEIHDDHIFCYGPHQETVPFVVGSNQEILPFEG